MQKDSICAFIPWYLESFHFHQSNYVGQITSLLVHNTAWVFSALVMKGCCQSSRKTRANSYTANTSPRWN